MNVYAVKIPKKMSDYDFINYLNKVPAEKKEKLKDYLNRDEAVRSLFGVLLIRKALYENTGANIDNITFRYNDYGKPLVDVPKTFHFNVSHSDEWVVCATDNLPIGIDIERINPIDLEIAKQFFTKEEYEFIISRPDRDKISTFYEYWTLKESYIKAIGKGLSIPLNSFSILNTEGKYFIKEEQNPNYHFYQRKISLDYVLALCSQTSVSDFKITYFKYNNLV
ncbi:4'-phosphopantetheinyl transferase superfamily protein [Lentibacillus sp. N15]|uniref:4'-phosphopantetheinyl transferase family protein n=1 Tax=Lentibacillus songyuanensis TaxID=3136161 RepID=UPI0031BA9AE7